MHEVFEKLKQFECEDCEEVFRQEADLLEHKKINSGVAASSKE